jgi:hypothetical protein
MVTTVIVPQLHDPVMLAKADVIIRERCCCCRLKVLAAGAVRRDGGRGLKKPRQRGTDRCSLRHDWCL